MARITIEDCLEKIDSQYDLVLLAKERTAQLNSGEKPLVPEENDKNTVIALREIGDGKVSIKNIEDSAINKLRKVQDQPSELEDLEIDQDDDFDKTYKGGTQAKGVPKRAHNHALSSAMSHMSLAILLGDNEMFKKPLSPSSKPILPCKVSVCPSVKERSPPSVNARLPSLPSDTDSS